ncbi:right-handed parallel beta-helix repeat-containing protein [Thioflexithrix psekupsensis]|uniref:Right handed beta helix domain-containing protein n=1 Tax=Thioflexithrix psekupsensis TaxID=1570016 RepID=A0A251X893_9GAMM|nr:right-handed parallel beta-helix repeat-containing protein [Thioflexithrix psekupsensis]OUD14191.1 hypothetical protein TPSD3_07625 [Thioflexithrix psekupsensis]
MRNVKKMMFWLLLCASPLTYAGTYYLAQSGNDSNDGLSPQTAWQTVENLNKKSFQDGDIFLFKRGDVFRGSIQLSRSPQNIVFSTYGEGNKPIISGSIVVSNWVATKHSALDSRVVYEADVSALLPQTSSGDFRPIQQLFVNGQLMTIARYPNVPTPLDKNWLKIGTVTGKDFFADPTLAAYRKPDNYWKGATIRVRDSWTFTVREITGYQARDGRLSVANLGSKLPEWGYFIDGKLEELDYPNEWHYDAANKKLYLYPPAGVNPNQALIEAAVYETGLNVNNNKHNTSVENLQFQHFMTQGMHVNSSNNVRVQHCYFHHNVKGITTWNTADVLIDSNEFHHHLHASIGLQSSVKDNFDVKSSTVSNNIVLNNALYRAYGLRYDGIYQGNAVDVFGKAYTVRGNYVENVAENGMYLKDGGHHLIENNVVKNALLILNDGGAISIGSSGNVIRGNFLSGSLGNIDESNGCSTTNLNPCSHHSRYGMGIGADGGFKDNLIENNVIFNNADMGIRLASLTNTIVRNNIVYNNDPQIVLEDKYGPSSKNLVENNIMISLHPDQIGLELTGTTAHGDTRNNYYCNPFSELAVTRDGQNYSLAHWRQDFPQYDKGSQDCGVLIPAEAVQPIGENLVSNSTFDTSAKSWGPTSKPDKLFHDTTKLDQGSLKIVYNPEDRILSVSPNDSFSLQQDQWYRFAFSVIANDFGNIRLRFNQTQPKHVVHEQRVFAMDKQRRDYEFVFQSKLTDSSMKAFFGTEKADASPYWLDNVSLHAVAFLPNVPAQERFALFSNPTYQDKSFNLPAAAQYVDIAGKPVQSLTLKPFTATVLLRTDNTLPAAPSPLPAPRLYLRVKQNALTLTWDDISGAKGYQLYYANYPHVGQIESADMRLSRQFRLQLPEGFTMPSNGVGFYVAVAAYDDKKQVGSLSNIEHFMLH